MVHLLLPDVTPDVTVDPDEMVLPLLIVDVEPPTFTVLPPDCVVLTLEAELDVDVPHPDDSGVGISTSPDISGRVSFVSVSVKSAVAITS